MQTEKEITQTVTDIYRDAPLGVRLFAFARTCSCPMLPLLTEVPSGATVFDIGCGNGLFLLLLAASGKIEKGLGVDCNRKVLLEAQKIKIKRSAEKQALKAVDFFAAGQPQEWPTMRFSVVSMIDVMHHVQLAKQKEFFFEAAQRVRQGGLLLYKDMCMRPVWRALINRVHDIVSARQWVHHVPVETIKKWAEDCGLALEKEAHYSKFGSGHEKLVFKRKL